MKMTKKRYRKPRVAPGEIKCQMSRIEFDDDVDICVFWGDGVPRCDRALIFNTFGAGRMNLNLGSNPPWKFDKSFLDELKERGYDLDTLRFSIKKKDIE